MSRYVFYSHDGYGLGHIRRNCVIAAALRSAEPDAQIAIVTSIPDRPAWLERPDWKVVRVAPLLKSGDGRYRSLGMSLPQAVARRREVFTQTIQSVRPHVVVVDRHPLGTAGELREGLELAARSGSALLLGLRDILDAPAVVAQELTGEDWAAVPDLFTEVLVYGARHFCDHEREYGLAVRPAYCGWVVGAPSAGRQEQRLLAAAAGGGADGQAVFALTAKALARLPEWRAEVVLGPFADRHAAEALLLPLGGRIRVHRAMQHCGALFARAGKVIQMAGYNSTAEALRTGHRPVVVPRRKPRWEQAIRAERLAGLGLVDVLEPDSPVEQVLRLLDTRRTVTAADLGLAGIDLRGAERAAARIGRFANDANPGAAHAVTGAGRR